GRVYRARDEVTERDVAFKQLLSPSDTESRRKVEALFEREYYTLVRLKHPRIVEVYDYGVSDSGPYYAMELLEGEDLQQRAPVPYRELCRHLRDIASSLALIHAHRLVHRDVSPRNVRFTAEGRAKLIDFGALTPFGPAAELVGTPMCTAPEALYGMPLDQRADLYALGAIAYWALTGRAAYPARQLADLFDLWDSPVAPPSQGLPELPPELDALILSLLSLDRLARPPNAAVVIEHFTAIAGLEPEEEEHTADSYLLSGGFVGRESELEWIDRRVGNQLAGRGCEIIIEGPSGIGRTRLLQEASLAAQLKGVIVLRADAQATPEPFGVAAALGVQLLTSCSEAAGLAAQPHAAVLGHLSPVLHQRVGRPALASLGVDPGERRARLQTALHEWFLELAEQRPLLLAVDNLHTIDDNSAAFLVALGQDARGRSILLLVTQRSRSDVVAPALVRMLQERSGRLRLKGLSVSAYEELAKSLFGEVPNAPRMATLLYERSAGNPQQCVDLVQILIKRQIVKYVAGTWVLPLDVSESELPVGSKGLIEARLSALTPVARALAEAASVQTNPVPLERFRLLVEGQDERTFYAALAELVAEQIFICDAETYRFAQESMRRRVATQMTEAARRAAHKLAAEAVLQTVTQSSSGRLEAGWHLLHAGEESRGADILAMDGRAFLAAQGGGDSTEHAIRALLGALEVYDRQGRSDYEIARVIFPLIPLAYFGDFRIVLQFGDRAIALGLKLTGLALAQKLRPFLGKKLALATGLISAGVKFAREQRRGLDYGLKEAIGLFCATIPAIGGVSSACLDARRLEQLLNAIEPLSFFSAGEFPNLMHAFMETEALVVTDRAEIVEVSENVMKRLREPKVQALLGEGHWKAMYAGQPYMVGLVEAYMFGSASLDRARELEELGVRVWAMAADQVRLIYHTIRGETERVREYAMRVEMFAVQGSTTWQAEMFYPAVVLNAHVLSEDAVALRRTWEQLTRRALEVPSLQPFADMAHAACLTNRGDFDAAIAKYQRILPQFAPRRRAQWQTVRAHFARALNAAGDHARAKALIRDTFACRTEQDERIATMSLESDRQLALAEMGLGNHAEAARQLDALLAKYAGQDQPLLIGLLHRARAEVALRTLDQATFQTHEAAMSERFRSAQNPALIGQCDRLRAKAAALGLRQAMTTADCRVDDGNESAPPFDSLTARSALSELRVAPELAKKALQLAIRQANASSGCLYIKHVGGMRLVFATTPNELPRGLETQLNELAERAAYEAAEKLVDELDSSRTDDASPALQIRAPHVPPETPDGDDGPESTVEDDDDYETAFVLPATNGTQDGVNQLFLLSVNEGQQRSIVGGMILEMHPRDRFRIHADFLESLSAILRDRFIPANNVTISTSSVS
ncbi:MAG TPA: AAA family ATPase, partial [Polyangiaceae bacterium]|nr:AAA family ATPase [Polyangiaceae bacterium]